MYHGQDSLRTLEAASSLAAVDERNEANSTNQKVMLDLLLVSQEPPYIFSPPQSHDAPRSLAVTYSGKGVKVQGSTLPAYTQNLRAAFHPILPLLD